MRSHSYAVALAVAAGFAAPAFAAFGQCYDAYGRPIGGAYDTNRPDLNFVDWVRRSGGSCTIVGANPAPPPAAPPLPQADPRTVLNSRPPADNPYLPTNITTMADAQRAAGLLSGHYRTRGHLAVQIDDTGRVSGMNGFGWKLYRVSWSRGLFEYAAVRRESDGGYIARFYLNEAWSAAVSLGY